MWNIFYRNPRLSILTVSLILVSGLSSYYVLPRMEDPLLTSRFALVNTRYPGADAERVESLVTEKIEEELREIEEIKELRSTSRVGVSTISIELRDDVYVTDDIWSRIRDKLDDAAVEMPAGVMKPDFDDLEVKAYALIAALTWDREDAPNYAILRRLAEQLEDEIKLLSGTEKVDTYGDPDEEIVATVQPDDLAALGLTAADVARQLAASDAKTAAGQFRGKSSDMLFEVDTELDSLRRIAETPIRLSQDGQMVQLSDVATIEKGIVQPPRSLALISGKHAVTLGVLIRSDVRVDHWTRSVVTLLDDYESRLPEGVGLNIVFQQNRYVEARLSTLLMNLLAGGVAVMAVIFVMMGWRNALVVGAALPLAALMVLSGLRALDIPIHQMSVTGLIIALGLLIDNAIVVVDEVSDRLKSSEPAQAVAQTVRHLAVPLFGSTLTTVLAFAPIILMEGPAGEFVGSIAVSVVLAIVSSFLLAMTVIPAMTAVAKSGGQSTAKRWWSHGFSHPRLTAAYRATLDRIFARPIVGIVLGAALPIAGFMQAGKLTEQFFPAADRDQVQIELELPSSASLQDTLATVSRVRAAVIARPDVADVHWFLGESAPTFYYNVVTRRKNTSHYAQALVQLRSAEGARDLIHQLQHQLDRQFPDARLLVRQLEQGPPFDAPIEVRLFGPDIYRLRELGEQVRTVLVQTEGVIHTRSELSEALPKLALSIDEEQARLAGLDHESIARQLDSILEGAVGGSVLESTEELPVRVRLPNSERANLSSIASLDLLPSEADRNSSHPGIPLSALASVDLVPELAAVARLDGQRMNELQAFIPAGVLPADVLQRFEDGLAASGFELPPGYSLKFGGEAAKRNEAVGNLMANVGLLMVLMVATLVLSFGSFRIAGVIGAVAALAAGLGLGALWLFGYPFGFMAIVGTMGLIGVAINDAIVVMAALRDDEQARAGHPRAVREVVVHSTRHVVSTSLTTMAGFTPLVLAGGGFWPPLAVTIAGGVGGATILALYFVPSAYILAMCRGCQEKSEIRVSTHEATPNFGMPISQAVAR